MSAQVSHSVPSRNPRRRQRNDSEDRSTLSVRQPQRKRSKLSDETFSVHTNGDHGGASKDKLPNGHVQAGDQDHDSSESGKEIPVRAKPSSPPSKRNKNEDGAAILTKNSNYMVKQLPSLPEQLRALSSGVYRATARPTLGLSLAVTQTHVYVWDYNSTLTIPPNRFFTIPHPSRNVNALPFGSFVTNGSTSEVGLVTVTPSGNVCFWENIENADALSLFEQRRNGFQGTVGSLHAGEQVVGLEPAEHAGFIVILSSGRVAQLLVRDTQSRPSIGAKFLRGLRVNTEGWFGGIKSALTSGGWLKNVVGAKSRLSRTTRSQVDLLIGNEAAQFQLWRLDWAGYATFERDINAKGVILDAAKQRFNSRPDVEELQVTMADFALSSHTDEEDDEAFTLDILLAVSSQGFATFAVAKVVFAGQEVLVKNILELSSYSPAPGPASQWKPKLCLPKESHIGFVVFEKAITVISVPEFYSDLTVEATADSSKLPHPFQDTIYFREGKDIQVLGAEAEDLDDKTRNPATIVFVKGFGVIRATAFEPKPNLDSKVLPRITAKSKIEQAVFYGSRSTNPLNLSKKSEVQFSMDEIEKAALDISKSIVDSRSPFIPDVATSMEYHLNLRASSLQALASHLKYTYPGISREIRWMLRWHAEKVAAAKEIWRLYDKSIKEEPKRKKLLPEIIDYLQDDRKSAPAVVPHDFDYARYYFIHDLSKLDDIVAWSRQGIEELQTDKEIPNDKVMLDLISDAIDILASGLETAFAFRQENAWLYDLDYEEYIDGVLRSEYDDLPEMWTSTKMIFKEVVKLAKSASGAAVKAIEKNEHVNLANKIGAQIGRLVRLSCLCYEERYRTSLGQTMEDVKRYGERVREQYFKDRTELIRLLPKTGLVGEGMAIAEKYSDMAALVDLLTQESAEVIEKGRKGSPGEKLSAARETEMLEARVHEYFDKFGAAWGDAYFSTFIKTGSFCTLLDQARAYDTEVTRFLNADKGRKKLSWMNEATTHKNYKAAGNALYDVASTQEEDLWYKKVELSLSKLSYLAADELHKSRSSLPSKAASRIPSRLPTPDPNGTSLSVQSWNDIPSDLPLPSQSTMQTNKDLISSALLLVTLQNTLFDHIKPTIFGATDEIASLQLAMAAYGTVRTANLPALQQLLERGVESLLLQHVMSPESLIDVFTLIDTKPCELPRDDISGTEFARALVVLVNSGLDTKDKTRFEMLLRTIWRRAYIADDWEEVSKTQGHSDDDNTSLLEGTVLFKTVLGGRRAGILAASNNASTPSANATILPPPPSPQDVLTAGTNPQDHSARFADPSLCEPIARDNAREDDILSRYIEDFGLEGWVRAAGEWADNVLIGEKSATGEDTRAARDLAAVEAEASAGLGEVEDEDEDEEVFEGIEGAEESAEDGDDEGVNESADGEAGDDDE